LFELHRILQVVMGWGNYHRYQFIIDGITYSEPDPTPSPIKAASEAILSGVVHSEDDKFIYVYDLTDDWQHVVKVEQILPAEPGINYPVCLDGERACPLEECGGIVEYANLLEILHDPNHPEYREMLEHFGGDFDPEAFDLGRVNRALRPIREGLIRGTPQNKWTEEDSKVYQAIAAVAVPAREEQMATLLTLLPFSPEDSFCVVELGCGEGFLAYALLDCFPGVEVIALDGSSEMRAQAAKRLKDFGSRVRIERFDLHTTDWLPYLQGADCVISSLVIHHLDGADKQRLFAAICDQLSPRGALFIADLIEPQRPEARELFAATWDRSAKAQAIAKTGSLQAFEQFVEAGWNHFRFPDPFDKPSPLSEQLTWLKAADFAVVDCFWLQAGHAIYGGYKMDSSSVTSGVSFVTALRSAKQAFG
jgi:tRNA (cmo5U34)-methyltransferase